MTQKKGKRAVIISNIKSNSIEQAIFILKSTPYDACFETGGGIVAEAQEIINKYISAMEDKSFGRKRNEKKKKIILAAGIVCVIASILIAVLVKG